MGRIAAAAPALSATIAGVVTAVAVVQLVEPPREIVPIAHGPVPVMVGSVPTTTTTGRPTTAALTGTVHRPSATTSTMVEPPLAACGRDELAVSFSFERPTYRPLQTVVYTSVVRNVSSLDCPLPQVTGECRPSGSEDFCMTWIDDTFLVDPPTGPAPRLRPGEEKRHEASWHQRACRSEEKTEARVCEQVAPGDYSLGVIWTSVGAVFGTVTIAEPS